MRMAEERGLLTDVLLLALLIIFFRGGNIVKMGIFVSGILLALLILSNCSITAFADANIGSISKIKKDYEVINDLYRQGLNGPVRAVKLIKKRQWVEKIGSEEVYGSDTNMYVYFYNPNGYLVKELINPSTADWTLIIFVNEYDSKGRLSKRLELETYCDFNVDSLLSEEYEKIDEIVNMGTISALRNTKYTYDSSGRLVLEVKNFFYEKKSRYSKQWILGNKEKIEYITDPSGTAIVKTVYDSHGEKIDYRVTKYENYKQAITRGRVNLSYWTTVKYDDYGNWIELELRDTSDEIDETTIWKREIYYFE